MLLQELREQVVYYGRQMLESGLTVHTGGNLSARDKETGLIAIKPTSKPYDLLKPEDITVIDLDGHIVDGAFRPSSEWPMHTLIYKTYPRVMGIVHCHSPYALSAAASYTEIPLICHELCMHCSSPVRVVPFEVPGSVELGESAICGFGQDNNAAILGNHGAIAVGATLWHAFDGVCAVEMAARTYQLARLDKLLNGEKPVLDVIPPEGRAALRKCDPLQKSDDGKTIEIQAV